MKTKKILRTTLLGLLATVNGALAQDGTYDTSWGLGGRKLIPVGQNGAFAYSMAIASDGKILLAGDCNADQCIARLLPNGDPDLSFGPNETGAFSFADFPAYPAGYTGQHGLLVQPDGRVIVAGYGLVPYPIARVTRLNSNGTLQAFQTYEFSHHATSPYNLIRAVALLANGKLIVAGTTARAGSNPVNNDFAVAQLNSDLTIDPTFNAGGSTPGVRLAAFDQGNNNQDVAYAVAIQNDGKIVVAGSANTASSSYDFAILRLNADGTPDTGFGNNGRIWFDLGLNHDDVAYAVRIDRLQRIVVAGYRLYGGTDYDFAVVRLLPSGAFDTSFYGNGFRPIHFDIGGHRDDQAFDLELQSDGKIVVAGVASVAAGQDGVAVARVLDNGNSDETFGNSGLFVGTFAPGAGTNDVGLSVGFGPGNHLFVAGYGASSPGQINFGLMRLNEDLIFANGFQ